MRVLTLSILFADLAGSTERQSRSSRAAIADDVSRFQSLLTPVFSAFRGELVKSMGDGFLVCFESPTDAVLSAVQIQKQLHADNARHGGTREPLHVRIGIATGEVSRDDGGDLFGEAVNLAARLQASAEPDAVWLAETTFLSMNKNEVKAFEVGGRVFKGIPGEVKVYRVLDESITNARLLSANDLALAGRSNLRSDTRRRAMLAMCVALVAGVGIYLGLRSMGERGTPSERYDRDPTDPSAATAFFEQLTTQLYDAEDRGESATLYREGAIAERIRAASPQLASLASLVKLRCVYLMANEPLAPHAPEAVLAAAEANAELARDARFLALLRGTVDYAAKEPAMAAIYARALDLLDRR
ncbi:MAG: adenylate/guanylate cyclase domain-containing protein [Planctomycetota bacterium]